MFDFACLFASRFQHRFDAETDMMCSLDTDNTQIKKY